MNFKSLLFFRRILLDGKQQLHKGAICDHHLAESSLIRWKRSYAYSQFTSVAFHPTATELEKESSFKWKHFDSQSCAEQEKHVAVINLWTRKYLKNRKLGIWNAKDQSPGARSIQPKFPEIPVQTSMDRFGPTGKVSKKMVHLLRWSPFPGRTGLNFGWMDRAPEFLSNVPPLRRQCRPTADYCF